MGLILTYFLFSIQATERVSNKFRFATANILVSKRFLEYSLETMSKGCHCGGRFNISRFSESGPEVRAIELICANCSATPKIRPGENYF
jgi:hypothetical protein